MPYPSSEADTEISKDRTYSRPADMGRGVQKTAQVLGGAAMGMPTLPWLMTHDSEQAESRRIAAREPNKPEWRFPRPLEVADEAPVPPADPIHRSTRSRAGMGGSEPSPVVSQQIQEGRTRRYSPEELIAMADELEQAMLASQIKGPAVDPSKDVQGDWLDQYMQSQANAGEFQSPLTGESIIRKSSMSDADKKKYSQYAALAPSRRK